MKDAGAAPTTRRVEAATEVVDAERTPVGPTAPPIRSTDLSSAGLLVAGLFFAFSLFPSLLPRSGVNQGIVSGVTLAIGYGVGTLAHWTWDYLGLPRSRGTARRIVVGVLVGVVGLAIAAASWQHVGWQNDARALMGIPPTSPATWIPLGIVTLVVFVLLLSLGRGLRHVFDRLVALLATRLPRRLSMVSGTAIMVVVLWGLWSGVIVTSFFTGANRVFAPRDTATEAGITPPTGPQRSGSPESLVDWDDLGRKGRTFVATGPTADDIEAVRGTGATEPVRVYVGLRSADTLRQRAALLLRELIRTGAFDREVLVVATTTGTGFLDEDGIVPLEYLHDGNTAIAGVQYSYLPSWISLLADQDVVKETSQVVFETVHDHWAGLPDQDRPELYLYGLSLGSTGVEAILGSIDMINEPIDGAVLAGPPFINPIRNQLVANRTAGSPPWLPVVDRGRTARFMARGTNPEASSAGSSPWEGTRILYVQHASDPVTFFSPDLAFDEPDWLAPGQRGPEVSDQFAWVPIVSMWQVLIDLPAAGNVPEGYGHMYSRADNLRAWIAVSRPDGWTDGDTRDLLDRFAGERHPETPIGSSDRPGQPIRDGPVGARQPGA